MSKNNNYKVYVHINKANGKRYFGITKQKVETRWANGKGYKEQYFNRAINKYGWDNFEHIVIAKGLTEEEAKWLEIELIREHDTTNKDKGYNISLGGESGNHTEETRKKISEANKGHEVSEETRKKIGEIHRGKIMSEESRKKMSEARKGKNTGKNNPMYGKNHSEESRKKISEASKKMWQSEEHRKKMSEARKGKNSANATKIYCVELDMYFNSVAEANEYIDCRRNISNVLTGRNKTAGGYHWLYAEEVNQENINKVMSKEYNERGNKGKNNVNAKQIYCVELNMYFDTVTEASKFLGCNYSNISAVLNGRNKTCSGYHFVYANEVNEENINRVMSEEYNINKCKVKIYCVELDKYFDTLTEAGNYVGCSRQNISKVLKGKGKTCGGYHWLYAEDVEKLDIENNKVS